MRMENAAYLKLCFKPFSRGKAKKRENPKVASRTNRNFKLHQKQLTDLVECCKMWHEIIEGSDNQSRKLYPRQFPNELHFD
jgi:hypothetical protein